MVKVQKVGVWKVDGQFFENADQATRACRAIVIREVLQDHQAHKFEDEAAMFSELWDEIERKTSAAMAGA